MGKIVKTNFEFTKYVLTSNSLILPMIKKSYCQI